MKLKNPDPRTGVDYARLGKAVETALIQDYIYLLHSTSRQIWSSFMRGVFTGLGGVVGATLGVAALLWILHLLGGLPVVGHWLQGAGDAIQQK